MDSVFLPGVLDYITSLVQNGIIAMLAFDIPGTHISFIAFAFALLFINLGLNIFDKVLNRGEDSNSSSQIKGV